VLNKKKIQLKEMTASASQVAHLEAKVGQLETKNIQMERKSVHLEKLLELKDQELVRFCVFLDYFVHCTAL
jgi:hypothetical protein